MMTHKRILVALSLTDGRDAAFERALALAKTSGAELYLLHAVPRRRPFSHRAAERLWRAAALNQRATAAGVRARTFEQHGDPADTIVLHAEARNADLIVMGTEPRTGWIRWPRRSVAERVLRRTSRPTLVVRTDETTPASTFTNVLVAVDRAAAASALVDAAARIAAGDRERLTVVHAVAGLESDADVRNRARWVVPEYRRFMLERAQRQLEGTMRPLGVTSDLRVTAGPPAAAIGAQAADVDADLIVVGKSRRPAHLGSTVARLLRRTARPLLIVPAAARAAQTRDGGPAVHRRAA